MQDSWKGEALLAVPKRSKAEARCETQSIAQRMAHARRRAAGVGQSQSGGLWARRIHAAAVAARIRGGFGND